MGSKLALFMICISFIVAGRAGDRIFADNFEQPRWVLGYYVGYERDLYPISEVDFSAITHLVVGRVTPNDDGSLDETFDIDPTNGPIFAREGADAAHAAGRRALLMVGGAGATQWSAAASDTNRGNFVANLLGTMDRFGFDGLDLDWEPISSSVDRDELISLATDLRSARPNIILTFPTNWTNSNGPSSDPFFGTLATHFDRINIMSYDMLFDRFLSGWQSWHSSPLAGESPLTPSSVASSVAFYMASGVPPEKLGVGIGFYGQCWHGVTGPRQTIPFKGGVVASDGTMSYSTIMTSYFAPSIANWDPIAQVPWLGSSTAFGPQACTFLSYEDAHSISLKGAYVKQNELGGVIIWTVAQGHLRNNPAGRRDPLLGAVRDAFLP
jgi:chitinase